MQDILENCFPYNQKWYESKFINKKVLRTIEKYCKEHPIIEKVFAKGSLIYGCTPNGSDVDHVRIQVNKKLSLEEKKELVNSLEEKLKTAGITNLERIREDNYIRVFVNWDEIGGIPNAHTTQYEIYPEKKVITADDAKDWCRKVISTGHSCIGQAPDSWIFRAKSRILGRNFRYDIEQEQINIDNYSPFCHINEMSPEFQKDSFMLPFIKKNNVVVPVHPDTFKDLGLNENEILFEKKVTPTSSFRTVYSEEDNVCFKLPLLRRITREIRKLPDSHLIASRAATEKLKRIYCCPNFNFLEEVCNFNEDENFNFIVRFMPSKKVIPWFTAIKTQKFDSDFYMTAIHNMVHSSIFFASRDLYLEGHTQNWLVDKEANVYYRDLSDITSIKIPELRPPYAKDLNDLEIACESFDRSFCRQNLDHFFRYDKHLGEKGKEKIKETIKREMEILNVRFPDYSIDFVRDAPEHIPIKVPLTHWRDFI